MFTIPPKSKVKINYIATGTYGFALTDTDDKVLEYCNTYNTSVTEHTFSYQENECKLYVSASKFSSGYYDTEKGTKNLFNTIVNNLNELNKDVTAENYWKGKTLWWCGTSIPAGGNTNYPNIVSKNLDCTVINKAVGGSMCRANVRTGDYHGALFDNITSALSMTKEEIELFITNYASIQPYLRSGAPATLSDSNKARLRAASFEDRLLPYLDGTYPMPDLFVIDHGHNDWKYTLSNGNSDITLEPTVANIGGELAEDTFMTANNNAKLESFLGSLANIDSSKKAEFIASLNRNCYIGAINFIITLILKYNPRARIVFISNYEYENGDTPVYAPLITAQEYNANGWAFPLCEVYKYLGFSNHIIPGTKDYWASAGYTSTKDLDVFKIYCPDNVHPHSDTSGITNRIYAGVISEFLKKCR